MARQISIARRLAVTGALVLLGVSACTSATPVPPFSPPPEIKVRPAVPPTIVQAALAPDEAQVAWMTDDWTVSVVRLDMRNEVRSLHAPGQVFGISWIDARRLAGVTHTSAVIWDTTTNKEIARVPGDEHTAANPLGSMAVDPTGARVALVSDPAHGGIDVIDAATGDVASRLMTGIQWPAHVGWVGQGNAVVVEDSDLALEVWDVASSARTGHCTSCGKGTLLSPDGLSAAVPSNDALFVVDLHVGTARAIDAFAPPHASSCWLHPEQVRVAFAPYGSRAVVTSKMDCTPSEPRDKPVPPLFAARVYDTKSWKAIRELDVTMPSDVVRFIGRSTVAFLAYPPPNEIPTRLVLADVESGETRKYEWANGWRHGLTTLFGRTRFVEVYEATLDVRSVATGDIELHVGETSPSR